MFLLPTARNGRVDAPLQITEIHRPRRLRLDGTRLLHAVEHAPAVLVEEGRPDGAGATAGVDVASGLLDYARVPVQVGHGLDRISGPDHEVHPGVHPPAFQAYGDPLDLVDIVVRAAEAHEVDLPRARVTGSLVGLHPVS